MQSNNHFKCTGAEAATHILEDNFFTSGLKEIATPTSSRSTNQRLHIHARGKIVTMRSKQKQKAERLTVMPERSRDSPELPKY